MPSNLKSFEHYITTIEEAYDYGIQYFHQGQDIFDIPSNLDPEVIDAFKDGYYLALDRDAEHLNRDLSDEFYSQDFEGEGFVWDQSPDYPIENCFDQIEQIQATEEDRW